MFKYIFASLVLYSSYWRETECWLLFSIPFEFNIVRVLLLNSILPVVVRIFLRTESCANELDNGVRAIDVYTCCRRQHIYIRIHLHKIPLCFVIHILYHQPIHRIFFFSFIAIEDLFLHHREMYWHFLSALDFPMSFGTFAHVFTSIHFKMDCSSWFCLWPPLNAIHGENSFYNDIEKKNNFHVKATCMISIKLYETYRILSKCYTFWIGKVFR